jgi:hypothetical protein
LGETAMMSYLKSPWVSGILFALLIAPTIISYRSYAFQWDDAGYLEQAINFANHVWSGDRHAVSDDLSIDRRPPLMRFIGLPWGMTRSWENASRYFVTLELLQGILAAICLYLLLSLGAGRVLLFLASVCVFASLGPYPRPEAFAHEHASGFLADGIFAWTILAACLLIPYEQVERPASVGSDYRRGVLWAGILSIGVLNKASFFYFLALILPCLVFVRWRRLGADPVRRTLLAFLVAMLPAIAYWARYGARSLYNGWAASFGHDAPLYYTPLGSFIGNALLQSPGLIVSGIFCAICLVIVWNAGAGRRSRLVPVLIVMGYLAICLAAPNRQIRYMFPAIISLPFLLALTASRTHSVPRSASLSAAAVAILSFAVLAAPTASRADRQSIGRSEAVLTEADRYGVTRMVLASDSPTFNNSLLRVVMALKASPIKTETFAFHGPDDIALTNDFEAMRRADFVVLQDRSALDSAPTNSRYSEYQKYLDAQDTESVVRIRKADLTIYCMRRCTNSGSRSAELRSNP